VHCFNKDECAFNNFQKGIKDYKKLHVLKRNCYQINFCLIHAEISIYPKGPCSFYVFCCFRTHFKNGRFCF
jgi:hypothetical protein